ncbi:Cytochrome c551 peroxidase [Commensalibacter sp. Nvir]|uniref:cytochrome-c peroxidase n=1 Tax=Commensalibacter sp. Nvir TaxID=3069817 RepID=UPI002D604DCC|nr:Cytochrome c551 peroxidase [Commensalibacter sp. Nvir]
MNYKLHQYVASVFFLALFTSYPSLAQHFSTPPSSTSNKQLKTEEQLGRLLFYDADLSRDGSMSCATCHRQKYAFTDGNKTHPGVNNDHGVFNVPTLSNVGAFKKLMWVDEPVHSLEEQALVPMTGITPVEMGMHHREKEIEKRIANNSCYIKLFNKAFPNLVGNKIALQTITQAIASFERTLTSVQSHWDIKDHYTNEMQKGESIFFGKGSCATCHTPPFFTDQELHQINGQMGKAYRTPTLRNVELTSPYFHDGSKATINEAILGHETKYTSVPKLSQHDVYYLEKFLDSLTDMNFVTSPDYALPDKTCN